MLLHYEAIVQSRQNTCFVTQKNLDLVANTQRHCLKNGIPLVKCIVKNEKKDREKKHISIFTSSEHSKKC